MINVFRNRFVLMSFLIGIALGVAGLAVTAAFQTRGEIEGVTFTTGNADIKFLDDLASGTEVSNLVDTKGFEPMDRIGPEWSDNRLVKIYNSGTEDLDLTFSAVLTDGNDSELRNYLHIEVFVWNDNGDGVLDEGELGKSFGPASLADWEGSPFDLDVLNESEVMGLVLSFSVVDLPNDLQAETVAYDFVFDGESVH